MPIFNFTVQKYKKTFDDKARENIKKMENTRTLKHTLLNLKTFKRSF